ncbi:histidine kinase [Georgenia satyanarayanai]|uniref:sensor histidine kinase n=1 Tax=Georgenia satyanarayanai TaxID=860221 RepID=UPI002041D1F8|nr:histidine kinase [Georgenia satyanarayanai]MCM3660052.1 histidine kinase [Georgenia satyanarayanai]
MDLRGRFSTATARAASRLGREPDTKRRWAARARVLLYVGVTCLLGWELYISQVDDLPTTLTIVQVTAVLVLYGLARWPVVAAALSLPLVVAEVVLGFHPFSLTIVASLLIAGVLVASRPRQIGYLYVLAVVVLLTVVEPTDIPLADLVTWLSIFLLPCVIGEAVRSMLKSVDRIQRTSMVQLARQRRDLARELHDTSIHDITSIIMALERAKLAGIDDPKVLEEIDHAIAIGRQSVVSMRGVLKILRTEDSSSRRPDAENMPAAIAAAAPTLQRALDEARASLERAGHSLQVHVEDHVDLPLPFSVRTALVRVIQECTANMVKYAQPGAPCTVMIERTDVETRALFLNDAREGAEADSALSSGVGLIGVRERVEAVGGSLAVRHHDGRWIIQASIPTISSVSEGQVERAAQH